MRAEVENSRQSIHTNCHSLCSCILALYPLCAKYSMSKYCIHNKKTSVNYFLSKIFIIAIISAIFDERWQHGLCIVFISSASLHVCMQISHSLEDKHKTCFLLKDIIIIIIIIIIIFHTVQDTFSVYCVPGSTPVPQNPMNVMVMVMVKLILNNTSPYPSPLHPRHAPPPSPRPPPPPPPPPRHDT